MSRLRVILLVYAGVAVVGAYLLFMANIGWPAVLYVGLNGLIVGVAVIFERGRYSPTLSAGDDWEDTDEKFQDTTTGKWMIVRYNRHTGERDYVEMKDQRAGK